MSFFDKDSEERTTLKDVYTIDREPSLGGATYFILWGGDKGCYGGSGTYSAIISEVSRVAGSRPFLVQNDDALGKDIYEKIKHYF